MTLNSPSNNEGNTKQDSELQEYIHQPIDNEQLLKQNEKTEILSQIDISDPRSSIEAISGEIEYPTSYRGRMKLTSEHLQKVLDYDENLIQFGPTYHLNTSSGEPLSINNIHFDYQDRDGNPRRTYYLIAQDSQGRIVGDRSTSVRFLEFQGKKYARAEGMLATGKRGVGIGTAIELAHIDLLQREANRNGQEVRWHISNRNAEELQEMKEEYSSDPTTELAEQIEIQKQEQERWQGIYGPGGKLGFDESWEKIFHPNSDSNDVETPLQEVNLIRTNDSRLIEVQSSIPVSSTDKDKIRIKQVEDFRSLLGSMNKIAGVNESTIETA